MIAPRKSDLLNRVGQRYYTGGGWQGYCNACGNLVETAGSADSLEPQARVHIERDCPYRGVKPPPQTKGENP